MKIETGKFYVNKTRKLLLPCLKDHGEKLMKAVNSLQKLAVGIGDHYIEDSLDQNNLFLLVDTRHQDFSKILIWLKKQPFFVKDYPFDDILSGYQHIIILKIPDDYQVAKTEFVKGKYSRMYTKNQVDHLFGNVYIDVFARDQKSIQSFVDTVNKVYDANIQYEKWEGEVDFPPIRKEEVFSNE